MLLCSALLSGCVKSVKPQWQLATPKDIARLEQPGQTTIKGTPSVLGLSWTASPQANRAALAKAGLKLKVTRRIEGGQAIEVHEGQVFGRMARVVTTTQGRLQRVVIQWKTGQGIDRDYTSLRAMIEKQYGKSPSLFMPSPPSDVMYRAYASRKQTPITGWVFSNGWAMGLSVDMPYKEGGDTSVMIELSIDSRDWRIKVGPFTQPK